MSLESKIKKLPQCPGVYMFKDAGGTILYIGKAKNLRARVSSYLSVDPIEESKTSKLMQHTADLDFIEVLSEIEALILEAYLIQKHRPHYNIVLKDDKSFLYIEIRNEEVLLDGSPVNLPKLRASRKSDLKPGSLIFGPFPGSSATRFVLRSLRRYLPYRDCSKSKFNRYRRLGCPCLYGKIDLCPAPCVSKITPEEYRARILDIKTFLQGKGSQLVSGLEDKMAKASEEKDYEKAAYYRDLLRNFRYIRSKRVPAELYAQNPHLLEDLAKEALLELKELLPILSKIPKRIECYDISDLGGKNAVGSMVTAISGRLEKSFYRRFKIKSVEGANDFAKMAEVLDRRVKRMKAGAKGWEKPDLIVLDGGKGQLSSVLKVFEKHGVKNISLVGLAKREETLIYFFGGKFHELKLASGSKGLSLLIRLRDEAHRFAQDYHHKLRLRNLLE